MEVVSGFVLRWERFYDLAEPTMISQSNATATDVKIAIRIFFVYRLLKNKLEHLETSRYYVLA